MKKNVILISIDTLSYNRLGVAGNKPSPSPFIDQIFEKSYALSKCFSAGSPTQMSFTSLMTSTHPLDEGGYNRGIKDRGLPLAEIFRKNGYRTAAFITGNALQKYYGYDRGFDEFYQLISPFIAAKSFFKDHLNFYKNKIKKNEISTEESCKFVSKDVFDYFDFLEEYCMEKIKEQNTGNNLIYGWDFESILSGIKNEKEKLLADNDSYISNLIMNGEAILKRVVSDKKINKTRFASRLVIAKKFIEMFIDQKFNFKKMKKFKVLDLKVWYRIINDLDTRYVSADYLYNQFFSWFPSFYKKSTKPFFIWMHFCDLHPRPVFFSRDSNWKQINGDLYKSKKYFNDALNKKTSYDGNLFYDLSLNYTDEKFRIFFEKMNEIGVWENTNLVFFSDHGSKELDYPKRNYKRHYTGETGIRMVDFYDELYHVPVFFYGKDIKPAKEDGMTSLMDVAPTILQSAGLKVPSTYKGKNLLLKNGKIPPAHEYLIMENLDRGPCDFSLKNTVICVRTETRKLVCEFNINNNDYSIREYFNLIDDPLEQNNLFAGVNEPELQKLINIAKKRLNEIKNQI